MDTWWYLWTTFLVYSFFVRPRSVSTQRLVKMSSDLFCKKKTADHNRLYSSKAKQHLPWCGYFLVPSRCFWCCLTAHHRRCRRCECMLSRYLRFVWCSCANYVSDNYISQHAFGKTLFLFYPRIFGIVWQHELLLMNVKGQFLVSYIDDVRCDILATEYSIVLNQFTMFLLTSRLLRQRPGNKTSWWLMNESSSGPPQMDESAWIQCGWKRGEPQRQGTGEKCDANQVIALARSRHSF